MIRKPKTNITFRDDSVHKTGPPSLLAAEVEKMIQGHGIGQKTGLFTVPEVLEFVPSHEAVTMQYVRDMIPLRNLAGSSEEELLLFEKAGKALCMIHQELELPKQNRIPLPDELRFEGAQVMLHGDFTKTNVCSIGPPQSPSIVIIDWQMTAIHGGEANYGTPLFDVAWFVSGLFLEPPHKLVSRNLPEKARRFISAYLENSTTDKTSVANYLNKLHEVRTRWLRSHPRLMKRIFLKPGMRMWRTFNQTM